MKDYRTTEQDFKYFKQCALRWQAILSLGGWEIFFNHVENENNYLAWIDSNTPGRCATIGLNKNWHSTEVSKRQLSMSAFHEICELLLERLDDMARHSFSDEIVNEARHEIIRVMEKVIWEADYGSSRK